MKKLEKRYQDLKLILEVDIDSLVARCYKPTPKAKYSDKKQIWGYRFGNQEQLNEYIEKYISNKEKSVKDAEKRKAENKARDLKEREAVKVGDIFCYSWGWEQTNVNFYQVVEKPSASTIIVREIGYKSLEETSWASEKVRPVKDSFISKETEKVRLSGKYFKRSCGDAIKVDNPETSSFYRSWYA